MDYVLHDRFLLQTRFNLSCSIRVLVKMGIHSFSRLTYSAGVIRDTSCWTIAFTNFSSKVWNLSLKYICIRSFSIFYLLLDCFISSIFLNLSSICCRIINKSVLSFFKYLCISILFKPKLPRKLPRGFDWPGEECSYFRPI